MRARRPRSPIEAASRGWMSIAQREGMAEGTGECHGEAIPEPPDLETLVALDSWSQGPEKTFAHRRVGIGSQLMQQFGRPNEVNEEKRDRGRLGHRRNGSRESTRGRSSLELEMRLPNLRQTNDEFGRTLQP